MSTNPFAAEPSATDHGGVSFAADIAVGAHQLSVAGVASPDFDAQCLAGHVLALPRAQVLFINAWPHKRARADFFELVRRRATREPLQHLTGSAPFRWLDILVGPGVFVPRPETELVAGAAIEAARERQAASGRSAVVVDLFSGSGAIALALATEVPGCTVIAVEAEAGAIAWLRRNIAHHCPAQPGTEAGAVSIRLIAERVESLVQVAPDLVGRVDIVVANPPYLLDGAQLDDEVARFDPPAALFGGVDGLAGPKLAVAAAHQLLRPEGVVVIEHDDSHGDRLPALMRASGQWENVAGHHDLSGKPRYVTARLGGPRLNPPVAQSSQRGAASEKPAEVNQ